MLNNLQRLKKKKELFVKWATYGCLFGRVARVSTRLLLHTQVLLHFIDEVPVRDLPRPVPTTPCILHSYCGGLKTRITRIKLGLINAFHMISPVMSWSFQFLNTVEAPLTQALYFPGKSVLP